MVTAIRPSRFWVWFPAIVCVGVRILLWFLLSVQEQSTGDWLRWTSGLSRGYSSLLPSDCWDRLQHHLSSWSGINRITENELPDKCIEEINRELFANRKWKRHLLPQYVSVWWLCPWCHLRVYWSLNKRKRKSNKGLNLQGSFIAHQMISWTADHRSLSPSKGTLTRHVESARGKCWQGRRMWTVWGTKATWAFERGCYNCAYICCISALRGRVG